MLQDQYTLSALNVLLEYLTDTAVAPVQRDFVEIEDPFCTGVSPPDIQTTYELTDSTTVGRYVFHEVWV